MKKQEFFQKTLALKINVNSVYYIIFI